MKRVLVTSLLMLCLLIQPATAQQSEPLQKPLVERIQRIMAFAIYVNNVSVPADSAEIKRIVGQALGEIAVAAYETVR